MVDLIVDEYLPISWPEKPSVRKFQQRHEVETSLKENCKSKDYLKRDPFEFDFKSYKGTYGKPSGTVEL